MALCSPAHVVHTGKHVNIFLFRSHFSGPPLPLPLSFSSPWLSKATRRAQAASTRPDATSRSAPRRRPNRARSRPRRSSPRTQLTTACRTLATGPRPIRLLRPLDPVSCWLPTPMHLRCRALVRFLDPGPPWDQLSRLRPDTRDRIVQLCTRMGSPPLPKAPKSSFPSARPASAVPKADARLVQTDDLGFPLPAVPDPTEPTVVATTPSIRAARPTVVHPPPCLVQCPTPGCFNQCGRPVYGRGHRNHFCRICHRLHR